MGKKIFTITLFLVGALVIVGTGCSKKTNTDIQKQTDNSPLVEAVDENLSEQPDKSKYNEYFTNIFIAKLPIGAEFNPWKIIKTKVFTAGEQFCTSMDMKKQVPANTLSSAIYDVNAKQDIKPRMGTFPQALGPGNSTGCEPLAQTIGKYEYKIYINDILVAVLPFEVK